MVNCQGSFKPLKYVQLDQPFQVTSAGCIAGGAYWERPGYTCPAGAWLKYDGVSDYYCSKEKPNEPTSSAADPKSADPKSASDKKGLMVVKGIIGLVILAGSVYALMKFMKKDKK